MLKKIRGVHYPAAFVDWMIGTYGREELMPDDNTIMLMSLFTMLATTKDMMKVPQIQKNLRRWMLSNPSFIIQMYNI